MIAFWRHASPESLGPMLSHSLAVVRSLHPEMTPLPRAVVERVFLSEGAIGAAEEVAHHLGLTSRFQPARLLQRAALPPLHRPAEWATLETWVPAAQREGVSLCHI